VLILPMLPDTKGATDALNAWQREQAGNPVDVPVKPKVDPAATSKLEGTLKKLATAANISAAIGGAKVVVDQLGTSVFGLSEKTATAASKSLELAGAGAQVGAMFGPWGAAIGGVVGGLLGLVKASNEAAISMKALGEAGKRALEEARGQLELMTVLTDATKTIKDFNEQLASIYATGKEKGLSELQGEFKAAEDAAQEAAQTYKVYKDNLEEVAKTHKAGTFEREQAEKQLAEAQEAAQAALGRFAAAAVAKTTKEKELAAERAAEEKKWADASDAYGKLLQSEQEAREKAHAEKVIEIARQMYEAEVSFQQNAHLTWLGLQQKEIALREQEAAREKSRMDAAVADANAATQQFMGKVAPATQLAGALFGQMADNVAKNERAFAGLGKTTLATLSDIMNTYARQWAFKAGEAAAAGWFSLGNPLTVAFAAPNFKAALLYGGLAAAAGIGGIALGKGSAVESGGSGAPSSAPSGGGGSGPGAPRDPGPTTLPTINYYAGPQHGTAIFAGTGASADAAAGRELRRLTQAAERSGPQLRGGR
jgi:hypothetical protein